MLKSDWLWAVGCGLWAVGCGLWAVEFYHTELTEITEITEFNL